MSDYSERATSSMVNMTEGPYFMSFSMIAFKFSTYCVRLLPCHSEKDHVPRQSGILWRDWVGDPHWGQEPWDVQNKYHLAEFIFRQLKAYNIRSSSSNSPTRTISSSWGWKKLYKVSQRRLKSLAKEQTKYTMRRSKCFYMRIIFFISN